ncbi:hypothetical protein F2Q69_00058464 [Brassica cretica]|uniref:Dirigent protein n=1 Tax=Brassica cretica TaxID=69181 RepID=A0A8S9RC09_BRACR|nr:hypothetical protein F2Q69_00058464 [Brassica cretica]
MLRHQQTHFLLRVTIILRPHRQHQRHLRQTTLHQFRLHRRPQRYRLKTLQLQHHCHPQLKINTRWSLVVRTRSQNRTPNTTMQQLYLDSISFFGVHRTAASESHLGVMGGTGKYVNARGFAIVKTFTGSSGTQQQQPHQFTDGLETVLQCTVYLSY